MHLHSQAVLLSAAAVVLPSLSPASADVVELEGVTEFGVASISRGFFSPTQRNVVLPGGLGRWQVNGDRNDPATNVFGIYTVFDIDGSNVAPLGATEIAGISLALEPAVRTDDPTAGGVQDAGNLSIWYTTNDAPIDDLNFISAAGAPFTPTGFGDQFDDRVLLSSGFEAEGIRTINRDLDIAAVADDLLAELNAGTNIRLLLASTDPGAVFQFGTGNPPSSTILPFAGAAPTVSFDVTLIPEPASLGLLGVAGLGLLRRRKA
ncbi:MAG: PEP-CTERM sorting domain-containing protein [Planctomycetota bacterium]